MVFILSGKILYSELKALKSYFKKKKKEMVEKCWRYSSWNSVWLESVEWIGITDRAVQECTVSRMLEATLDYTKCLSQLFEQIGNFHLTTACV